MSKISSMFSTNTCLCSSATRAQARTLRGRGGKLLTVAFSVCFLNLIFLSRQFQLNSEAASSYSSQSKVPKITREKLRHRIYESEILFAWVRVTLTIPRSLQCDSTVKLQEKLSFADDKFSSLNSLVGMIFFHF